MDTYDLKGVKKYKKLLKAKEDYWDENLSVEFCIARRTRDILLGRKIVDDFVQSQRTAQKRVILDFELEAVWQEYFKTYIKNAASIADFWGIFINPSEQFKKEYSDIDEILFPKVLEAQESDNNGEELEAGYKKLLRVFKEHRNISFWENEKEWEWFFSQFLKYLNNFSEQVCRDGLGFFIGNIIKMHLIVENSGWEIDYGLYDNPISVWGGQSLLSKFRVHRQAMGFKNKAISNLGWQKRGLGLPIASRFFGLIFTYLFHLFLFSFLFIGSILIGDLIISTIFFIFTGNWTSIVQMALNYSLIKVDFLTQENWRISTDLIGLNFLVNEFIALQYSPTGRWTLSGISFLLIIVSAAGSLLFDKNFLEPNEDTTGSEALAAFTMLLIIAPLYAGLGLALVFYLSEFNIFG